MPWKEELPSQGPAPSSSAQKFDAPDSQPATNATGNVSVSLAPLSRFPWEVRLVEGNIRVYKGVILVAGGGGYESRNSHIKIAGRTTNPIKIVGSRISSPGDYDWEPSVNQRDPYASPPDGPGEQVAWPPTYIGGSNDVVGTSPRDPEPKDGGTAFDTYGQNIGKNGYGATGADGMPWFTFSYATGPIYLSGRTNSDGDMEFGVFQGTSGIDTSGWKVLIAYVESHTLIHQFFRSDISLGSSSGANDHPFKVTIASYSGGTLTLEVRPGTVNNIIPSNVLPSTIAYSGSLPAKVYLRVKYEGSPAVINQSETYVAAYSDDQTSDDTYTYLKLAEATDTDVTQLVLGSVWLDRLKVGSLDARYFYARV